MNTPEQCYIHHANEHKQQIEQKVLEKFNADPDSILGTYYRVNPELNSPELNLNTSCNEMDRKIITRYRTGCHKLKIQTGRLAGDGRDTRLCTCGEDIQTLNHVLFSCNLTEGIRTVQSLSATNLNDFFKDTEITQVATILRAVSKQLKI